MKGDYKDDDEDGTRDVEPKRNKIDIWEEGPDQPVRRKARWAAVVSGVVMAVKEVVMAAIGCR